MSIAIRIVLFLTILTFTGRSAFAGQITLTCDNNVAEAASYRLYKSLDVGQTWQQVAEVPRPADPAVQVQFVVQAEEGQLVLYKATAVAPGQESGQWRGAWYDSRLKPLTAPVKLGAE